MAGLLSRITDLSLNRRDFIKASSAAIGSLSLVGCGSNILNVADAATESEEKWITAGCIYDCGSRCLNKVLVKDGIVIRQKTDDLDPDSPDFFQHRACNRGRALRKHMLAADKLKYPMKRKNWEPGGGKKELRGKDEWVRISWDEALDILASELKNVKEKYGNRAILSTNREVSNVIKAFGGHVTGWGTTSFGAWGSTAPQVGYIYYNPDPVNDRFDMRNCETVILFGGNPAWSSPASALYHSYLQVKKAGAKFIIIDPIYTDTSAALDAEWIPIRPSTDGAMLLGIAHTLITEDDPVTNPLIDWNFLKRYTIGFDAESVPEGADPKENFKDYVLGTYDGQPKTPEWASEICGVEPNKIRYLARELRKDKKVALLTTWASARTNNADNLPQLFITIGAMTGHIGKSGHMTGDSAHRCGGNGGPFHWTVGGTGLPNPKNPVDDAICTSEIWQRILDGKYIYTGGKDAYLPPEERDLNIRAIIHTGSNALQTWPNVMKGIEVHRKVDFVATVALFPTLTAQYADLVLPATTIWERIGDIGTWGTKEAVIVSSQVMEPLYEAKSDRWIAEELMKRLGLDVKELFPISEKQVYFNQIAGATVQVDQKTYVPLVTITEADLAEWGVEGQPQQGKIGLKEFIERGIYKVKRTAGDNLGNIALKEFIDDPEANPVGSDSGKIEIHCKKLADNINRRGFSKIRPIPTWIPVVDGYQDSFTDWDKKIKGEYPYQVVQVHHLSKAHTNFANNPWLLEAWDNPIYMNTKDAAANGVSDGDPVVVSSKYGKVLRRAHVTERIMPGVMAIHHGCWTQIDEATGIDIGGGENTLLGAPPTGVGLNGYNSCLVKIEKWTGNFVPDVNRPLVTIE